METIKENSRGDDYLIVKGEGELDKLKMSLKK